MKKFKTKRNNNSKLILLFFIIIFFIIFIILSFQKLHNSYDNIIKFLLKDISREKNNISILKNFNYLVSNYYFENKKNDVKNNNMVYLYNSHDNEMYCDNTSVLDASKYLQNNLNKLGIKAIIEEKKVSDYLIVGKKQYEISREFIKNIKNKDDFFYYIDIHRDSVNDTKITINNKKYAKILFVLGLDNPNYLNNKKILEKMNDYLDKNYPGLSKGILEKSGDKVDGVYNQDLGANVLLMEIGGIENDSEEVNNSTEIIALMLYNFLGDKK